ncbi:MAG: hypothetical protein IT383_14900 [Deltaproteobacteria bacterium]|nr:hypothetical protein [Deltaproteobacteria bacterium]
MAKHDTTLPIDAFAGLIDDMCTQASAELDATRERLEALGAERDPPG